MSLKEIFSRAKSGKGARVREEPKVSVQELMELEKWDEAEKLLNDLLKKRPNDTPTLRKLADVYAQTSRVEDAVATYKRASDQIARDGFYDRAIATLARAAKVDPGNAQIAARIEQLRALKDSEGKGSRAVDELKGQERSQATKWLQIRQDWRKIRMASFVQMLDEEQIPLLFDALVRGRAEADEVLAQRGTVDSCAYIIVSGEVRAELPAAGEKSATLLRAYGPGDILGDRSLFEREAWRASYLANQPTAFLKLTREGLERALVGNPDPRQLLNALRSQRRDREVAELIEKLGHT